MSKNFPSVLERLMNERGTSVIEIAEAAQVERQTVYNWLAGGHPRREPLKRLCKFLKMNEAELMHGKVEFNDQRLTKVIELVELAAEKNAVKLSAGKKAKIIALFYQRMAQGDEISPKEVAAIVKISA